MALVSPALVDLAGTRQFRYLLMALSGDADPRALVPGGMEHTGHECAGARYRATRDVGACGNQLLRDRKAADGLG